MEINMKKLSIVAILVGVLSSPLIAAAVTQNVFLCVYDDEIGDVCNIPTPSRPVLYGMNANLNAPNQRSQYFYLGNNLSISGTDTLAVSGFEPAIVSGTATQYLRGDKSWQTLDKAAVGLGSVENTALSTWAGSANLATLGTITNGTWNATAIAISKGGTGQTTATAALNALLPSQAGNSGKVLLTDGSNATWTATSTPARIQTSATRSLDTCFQIAPTRDVLANYSVEISSSLSLSGGQDGTVFMEIFNDSGCTTGTQEVSRIRNGNTGTLTVGLNIVQTNTGNLTGFIPAGKWVKIRTSATTGTPTFTYRSGQETSL
jgi:hypothetical protein